MDYSKCKQALYDSEAMEKIPDRWKEEVPIIFDEFGKTKIGFLFSFCKNGKTKLKGMIAVSVEDMEVTEYTIEDLKEKFQVSDQYMEAAKIDDYDIYFSKRQLHESMISGVVNGNDKDMESVIQLTKKLFSIEQYEKIVLRIGVDFYK